MKKWLYCVLFFSTLSFANNNIVNVYSWDGYFSDEILRQFQDETGIKVNFSVFESNLSLYSKLKTQDVSGYDVILPTSYFVKRMREEKMLEPLDKTKLSNIKHIDPRFMNLVSDPNNIFSIPFLWGTTGIVINTKRFKTDTIQSWSDLWRPELRNQLLLLNDERDVFMMALLALGYSPNDNNAEHVKEAFQKLIKVLPNVRLFNSMAIPNILIDEDVYIAMVWSGEAYIATLENPNLRYLYPKDGFAIALDCIAIPKGSPHINNAHLFINFVLRPDIAKKLTMHSSYATPNLTAQKLLPDSIRQNPIIFPDKKTLARGHFQTNTGDVDPLFVEYWENLKFIAD